MIGSGSIGVPYPGAEIRLCDDNGEEVGHGQPGEIWMKAPGFFKGYLNQPEALVDGWMQSGDVGQRDERGYLYFLGRKKDIIRRSGENVAAAEVEDVLRSHSRVLEAAVVPVPDELRGEEVKAYVGVTDEAGIYEVSPAELVVHCRERLAKHKVPRYIEFRVEPFPRTPSMRVKKSALVAEARDPFADAWDRDREMPDWARRA
jgi:crotonobetaine/carnitine-CoA ligase